MTLSDLVKRAEYVLTAKDISLDVVRDLARGVVDLLGELSPCGFEEPEVRTDKVTGGIFVPSSWVTEEDNALDENATRAMARMLLNAADRYQATK